MRMLKRLQAASTLQVVNVGNSTYIAFSPIVSLSALAVSLSYAIVLARILHALFNGHGISAVRAR